MPDWTQTRKKGERHFILVYGVLFWGLLSGILFLVIQYFVFGKTLTNANVFISMIIFAICGYFFGKFLWIINERAAGNRVE